MRCGSHRATIGAEHQRVDAHHVVGTLDTAVGVERMPAGPAGLRGEGGDPGALPYREEFTGWSWSDGVRGTVPFWYHGKVRRVES